MRIDLDKVPRCESCKSEMNPCRTCMISFHEDRIATHRAEHANDTETKEVKRGRKQANKAQKPKKEKTEAPKKSRAQLQREFDERQRQKAAEDLRNQLAEIKCEVADCDNPRFSEKHGLCGNCWPTLQNWHKHDKDRSLMTLELTDAQQELFETKYAGEEFAVYKNRASSS